MNPTDPQNTDTDPEDRPLTLGEKLQLMATYVMATATKRAFGDQPDPDPKPLMREPIEFDLEPVPQPACVTYTKFGYLTPLIPTHCTPAQTLGRPSRTLRVYVGGRLLGTHTR